MKILVSDKLEDEGIDVLKAAEGFEVDRRYGMLPDELKAAVKGYDALIVRSTTQVTAEIIDAADRLKVIGRAGVGLDNIDLDAAERKGLKVVNTPLANTASTAEHAMSLILALARNIPQAYASLKAGVWDRGKHRGVEINGKTLGVIGLGHIGSAVTRLAKAFGMEVLTYDPFLSSKDAAATGAVMTGFEELLAKADFITLHVPLSDETRNMISDKQFAMMKPSARLINCARGGIVDEAALVRAIEEGRIAGCALDVYATEPLPPDSPLLKIENCICVPHLGAATFEAKVNVAVEVAQRVRDALLG